MQKEILIVAGPNGAGKTTFAEQYLVAHPRPFLSADSVAQRLNPEHPEDARLEAGRLFFQRFDSLAKHGDSFVVESTLSGRGLRERIIRLKRENYAVTIAFVFLDSPELCLRRVRERVRKGGHPVPEADVVRRFARSQQNFWRVYRPLVDEWQLFYNAATGFELVATGQGDAYQVSDISYFRLFQSHQNDHA